jgi:hypothetical protein
MAAKTVWWFHPLVGWAGRWVSREAERCCDEAVIAELSMRPADYARSLLRVLEHKHLLTPVPTLPGVRPVEVTSKRMERIMRLGQGSRKRSPWWCWVVMLLATVAVLPGAAWVAAEEELPKSGADTTDQACPPLPKMAPSDEKKGREETGRNYVTYDVESILADMRTNLGCNERQAKGTLVGILKNEALGLADPIDWTYLTWGNETAGRTLVACQTKTTHSLIAAALRRLREHGVKRVEFDISVISVPRDQAEKLLANHCVILDQKEAKEMHARVRVMSEASEARVLAQPRLLVPCGLEGSIRVGDSKPFVMGFRDGKPEVKYVSCGISLTVLPTLLKRDRMRVKCRLGVAHLGKSTFRQVKDSVTGKSVKIESPVVAKTEVHTAVGMSSGQTVIVGGPKCPDRSDASRCLIATIRPIVVDEEERISTTKRERPVR